MQAIPKDVKELQDLVEFLNYDREILMSENKRLKALLENNEWEKKYYEILEKLETETKKNKDSKKNPEIKQKIDANKVNDTKGKSRRIRVTLKSQKASTVASPVGQTKSLAKASSGYMKSNLDVTISKACKTLITYERNRSTSKKRVGSPDTSFNSSRFGTPKRSRKNIININ